MKIERRALLGVPLVLLADSVLRRAVADVDASAWSPGLHAKARLLAGDLKAGAWQAGLEIVLDPGFKTYWRTPGSSGVPPRFDFSRSRNLAGATVHYPAPLSFSDGAGLSYGYKNGVVFPIEIKPTDAAQPVELLVNIDYAACQKLCIPERAETQLMLRPNAGNAHAPAIAEAMSRVPKRVPLATGAGPAILAVARLDDTRYRVETRPGASGRAELFAEGDDGWYFDTAPTGQPDEFELTLVEKPADADARRGRARLTLVTPAGAIETTVALDASSPKP